MDKILKAPLYVLGGAIVGVGIAGYGIYKIFKKTKPTKQAEPVATK